MERPGMINLAIRGFFGHSNPCETVISTEPTNRSEGDLGIQVSINNHFQFPTGSEEFDSQKYACGVLVKDWDLSETIARSVVKKLLEKIPS